MHWPHGWLLFVIGILGTAVFYSISFYHKSPKRLFDYSKILLLISFLLHYIIKVLHLPHGHYFRIAFQIFLITTLVLCVRDVLFPGENTEEQTPENRKQTLNNGLSYLLYGIAAIGILVGAQIKILHWEIGFITGNMLLTIGLIAIIASLFIGKTNSKS